MPSKCLHFFEIITFITYMKINISICGYELVFHSFLLAECCQVFIKSLTTAKLYILVNPTFVERTA